MGMGAHVKYSTEVITVDFLEHIGLCKALDIL